MVQLKPCVAQEYDLQSQICLNMKMFLCAASPQKFVRCRAYHRTTQFIHCIAFVTRF